MADTGYQVVGVVDDADYVKKLEAEAKKKERGIYPRTIFIGVGGTGAKSLLHLRRLILERFGAVDALEGVAFLSVDTDVRSQEVSAEEERKNPLDQALAFERDERVNIRIDFKSYVGPNIIHHPQIREWWDEAALPSSDFQIEAGAGQIRPLARLAFFTNKSEIQDSVRRTYNKVSTNRIVGDRVDMGSPIRVVIVTGLAGGTGSGMLFDLAALVRHELQHFESPKIEGYLILPGGFGTVEKGQNYNKLAANGYAALRELNHYLTHPFEVQWEPTGSKVEIRGLYDRYVLFSGTNTSGEQLADIGDGYRTIGEILFLDFGAGPMAGWIQGVRINREQYLRSGVTYTYRLPQADGTVKETHTDQWRNAFASAGISKLVFPSWRLINKAKYDLAAEMVALLDPGRLGELTDVITNHRDRFMFDAGFFQGIRETEEGRRTHWQIRDRLAKQTGAGQEINSVYEHIGKYQHELAGLAESMYTEGNTSEECDAVWKRLANLWGDPWSPGNEGDWAVQVRNNRQDFIKEVHARLPHVIEDFRRKPAVGISGVVALLRNILETLDRPADQAAYTDWFKQERAKLATRMEEQQRLWKERVRNAERAARGFGKSAENHQKAVTLAGEAMFEYWRARVNDLICDEGEKALREIRRSLSDQLARIEQIADRMSTLESQYRQLADFYSQPQRSYVIREIEVASGGGDLLEFYLGRQADERAKRLTRLLDKGLRQMGLDSLDAIGNKLGGAFEQFRDNLAAQAFYALRGENGRTAAFVENPEDAMEGFIERYSIFRVLKENFTASKRQELYDQLYRKGMPWARRNQAEALLLDLLKPHGDSFIGYIADSDADIAQEMADRLLKIAETRFAPRPVRAYDPSEIIFYAELNAFPVYYMSEISSLRSHYDSFVNDTSKVTPLHVHQDYHKFQALIPFNTGQVANFQAAWSLFLQAQILGLICSLRQRAEDDNRVAYQWRRKVGPFQVQWTDLGPEGHVLRRLMSDAAATRQLRFDVEEELKRLQRSPRGGWSHLVALADYYYYCIFPVRSSPAAIGTGPLGSMENLVTSSLRQEWRAKDTDPRDREQRVKKVLENLDAWARPLYRDRGQIVPYALALRPEERQEEWALVPLVERAIREFIGRNELIEIRDIQGNPVQTYPRLALNWDYFEKEEPAPESVAAAETWHYANDRGQEQGLTAAVIAQRVRENPRGRHRVWVPGMANWHDATDIPAIASLVAGTAGPPSDLSVPPPDAPPPLEPPPLAPEPGAPVLFYYARSGQQLGQRPVEEIVRMVRDSPAGEHKVWIPRFGKEWRRVEDVPEIQEQLAPPPLG
jgi:tubulin-like protein